MNPHRLRPLDEDPAVAGFRDRAREVGARVRHEERETVGRICELLERVPLHIRLVASHARHQHPAAILEGLRDAERRDHLTRAELSDEEAHHQSLELSSYYTYDRLSDGGRLLWAVLAAIFAGAPDRDAIRDVYGDGAEAALDELLDWQIVELEDRRHRMAESLRYFGRAQLAEGELALDETELRARHAAHYLAVAAESFTEEAYQRAEWAAVEESDGADVFAAADWALAELERAEGAPVEELLARWDELEPRGEGVPPAGEFAYRLIPYVYRRRPPGGHRWLAGGLVAWRLSGAEEARARQALLCNQLGPIYDARGDYDAALDWYQKATALQEALGDRAGLAASYNNIGEVHRARGDYDAALDWYHKATALQEELGDRAGLAASYNNIGLIYKARGDCHAALQWYKKDLAITEELGDRAGLATTLHNMGHVALAQGDLRRALDLFTRSRDLYAEIGLQKDVAEERKMISEVQRRMGGHNSRLNR